MAGFASSVVSDFLVYPTKLEPDWGSWKAMFPEKRDPLVGCVGGPHFVWGGKKICPCDERVFGVPVAFCHARMCVECRTT